MAQCNVGIVSTLRCENLFKRFDGVHALDDFSLAFPDSGIVAIIGPNGAGKTTLIDVLSGFLQLDAGACYLGTRKINGLMPYRIVRLGIARTFQSVRLVREVSVLENVMLALPQQHGERLWTALSFWRFVKEEKRNKEKALAVLASVGLEECAFELASKLSWGQQKLVTLACCLATEASVFLLDEPVAGVDPEMAQGILELLCRVRATEKLIVFVEHDISAVRRIADTVVVMDEGRVIAQGSPARVMERPEIMEAYVG